METERRGPGTYPSAWRSWDPFVSFGPKHLSYHSTVEVGGYFFQPRSISHNGFIAAADWSRKSHEAAENDDNTEETPDGGEQSSDTRTTCCMNSHYCKKNF